MPTFKLKSAEKLEGDFGPGVNCAIGNDYGYLPSGPYRRPGYGFLDTTPPDNPRVRQQGHSSLYKFVTERMHPKTPANIDYRALDTTPPIGQLSTQDTWRYMKDTQIIPHHKDTLATYTIEARFTCSSCHAEFIQKFKGTHEDYEWLQHHYNKVDHVVVCEPCRNSCQWDDC